MKEDFVHVPGGRIWYKMFIGPPEAVPLIVIHGGPGSSSYPLQTLHTLSKDRTVVFYDQLGSGKSERPSDTKLWKTDRFVSEIEMLRKHLGFTSLDLLGHSWGTMLAVMYALKYPKQVNKMVLAGPYLSTERWIADTNELKKTLPRKTQEIIDQHEKAGTTDTKEYKDATLSFYKKYYCRIYPYPKVIRDGEKFRNDDIYNFMWGPTEFHCTGNLKNADVTHRLHEITIPVFLICGKYDMATPTTTKYYENLFPNATMKVLPKSAHQLYIEEQERFLKEVSLFLRA